MKTTLILAGLLVPTLLTAWNLAELDTARDVPWLSDVEKDVILEMNKVRSDPGRYAEDVLEPMRDDFQGTLYAPPGAPRIRTNEGVRALNDAVRALKSSPPRPPLLPSRGLSRAARDHAEDTGPAGALGHGGRDGSTMRSRIERYVDWDIFIGENISYGNADAAGIVSQLLIDDGVPSRGHRKNILNEVFAYVGVAVAPHGRFGTMCVQDFAGDVREL